MSSSEEDINMTPPDILNQAKNASESLLPTKSKEKYLSSYESFMAWRDKKKVKSFSENVFLAYFNEILNKYKPSSLWFIYFMLKSTVKTRNGIDIQKYSNLVAFLKRRSDGFRSRKSKVLSPSDVQRFLKEAPDYDYLATKVALIFGINGACRRKELCDITTNNIENHGELLLVKITDTKNKVPRSFTIHKPFLEIVKKYESLRNTRAKHNRYFQNYQKGKCTCQPIGIKKFGAMPQQIARFVGLENPEMYTGHSFRRTSATLLANSGADILTLKRHGGWRSNTVAETYIEESIEHKSNIGTKITKQIQLEPNSNIKYTEPRASTSCNEDLKCPSTSFIITPSPTYTQDTQNIIENNETFLPRKS